MTIGRPLFNADPHRSTVKHLALTGLSERKIAVQLGINRMTLRKHFPDELQPASNASRVSDFDEGIARLDEWRTPLDYMLSVINDKTADVSRRDRMAVAAAPFVHPKADDIGKKQRAQMDAESASQDWGDLIQPVPKAN